MERLKRKIDNYLIEWKKSANKLPLIVKGARRIGKTNAIRNFGQNNYKTFIVINFALQPQFKTIFEEGFEVDSIIKNITLKMPDIELNEHDTLIFLDEIQECVSTATSLKVFREDGRYDVMMSSFKEYMIVGGMPAIVSRFAQNKNFSGILKMQQQILLDYEEDITKYAGGLDKTKILNCYRKVPVFLGNENKKFQISKIADGARNREYVGVVEWLENAGIVNVSYAMELATLPLKGNYNPDNYRLYFADTGLLIGSLDEEVQEDLRNNENMNTYKGALYENIVSDMLVKEGYNLYFYKDDSKKIEMDFMVRDINSLVPIEVKANDNATISLNNLINNKSYKDIKYGIKLCNKNIGFNGKFYTFPYFVAFLLKRFLKERN